MFLQRPGLPSLTSSLFLGFTVNGEACANHASPQQRGVLLWGQAPLLSRAVVWGSPLHT